MTNDVLREIRVNGAAGALELEWRDNDAGAVPFKTLRARCPCAECRHSRRARAIAVAGEVTLVDVLPYGSNAVQLLFSDGHSRGIYPFTYLRALATGMDVTT